jgi:hypothetical protein
MFPQRPAPTPPCRSVFVPDQFDRADLEIAAVDVGVPAEDREGPRARAFPYGVSRRPRRELVPSSRGRSPF